MEQRDFRRVAGLLAGALDALRDQSGPVVQRAMATSVGRTPTLAVKQ